MKATLPGIKNWLKTLSFRTGLIVMSLCIASYAISFAQMLLPICIEAKSILWVIFFGLAKTFQYTSLIIIGKAGITRLKSAIKQLNKTN